MKKTFKVSAITIAIITSVYAVPVLAQDPIGPEYAEHFNSFFDESRISGNANMWMRSRDRRDAPDGDMQTNLDHGSLFVNLGFNSGYVSDTVGLDLMAFGTFDMWQNGSPDHEMNFWGVDNPYDKNPVNSSCSGTWESDCTDNGGSVATAALKFNFGGHLVAKAGYFQPSVPSTMGVNWSFAPGTFRGGEFGVNFDDLQVGFVYADEYKAPWFKSTYGFRTTDGEDAGDVYSVGLRYNLPNELLLEAGYGALTQGDRKNAHLKLKGTTEGGVYWSPQLYIVDDNEQYESTAFQLAFLSSFTMNQYTIKAEATYTSADSGDVSTSENMAYRLTSAYGGSNGAYDIWWNNRSDFNHDGEYAGYLSLTRDFSDIGATGFSAGVSGVAAAGAKVEGYDELVELAYSVFANYNIQEGALADATVSFHFTDYRNNSDAPSWAGYTNAFQDEKDFKVIVAVPFTIK